MKLIRSISYGKLERDKEVIDRLVDKNVTGKLDSYFRKYDDKDIEIELKLMIDEQKDGKFSGGLYATIDGKSHVFKRQNYKKLDDLVNSLFDHLKESLSHK
jgi:hypothetical protein